jgi:TfoX/Sxy family transcriptional regulator of competence genes
VTPEFAPLVGRVRTLLAGEPSAREVSMFGGVSFMANERMLVAVREGGLLIRVDPERHGELVVLPGAEPAEMGTGRSMKSGWLTVEATAIISDDRLSFWIGVALEYNGRAPNRSVSAAHEAGPGRTHGQESY